MSAIKTMPIVRMQFNLPEEIEEWEDFQKGPRALSALRKIKEAIRQVTKYSQDEIEVDWFEKFRKIFYEATDELDDI